MKKLNLTTETLRALTESNTNDVVGGGLTVAWLTAECPVKILTHFINCNPNSQFICLPTYYCHK